MLYRLQDTLWDITPKGQHNKQTGKVILFQEDNIITFPGEKLFLEASEFEGISSQDPQYLATIDHITWSAFWVDDSFDLDNVELISLRDVGPLDEQIFVLAGRALSLRRWKQDHQFCGRCGKPLNYFDHEPGAHCDSCNLTAYPRISPCVIVLVYKGDQLLLARNVRFKDSGMYSTLAGFIESGESAEQAVHREIFEEVGIRVKNVQYLNSQSWPFPHQLMLGFEAEYDSGDISLQEEEIDDARWFAFDELPKRAPNLSIAGWMINRFIEKHQ
ncbi:NAD(+) diphosphatase [Spirochaeta cellobiosiphila]|uniref:NAD(+) diphosphatase n=1 Tax=Spirochaeta cellobiosiphila TaxID=504483 RepID=UPI0003FD859D|nr:NAD(+) diphosphatase [Spirochaeta cellobiosiphila]